MDFDMEKLRETLANIHSMGELRDARENSTPLWELLKNVDKREMDEDEKRALKEKITQQRKAVDQMMRERMEVIHNWWKVIMEIQNSETCAEALKILLTHSKRAFRNPNGTFIHKENNRWRELLMLNGRPVLQVLVDCGTFNLLYPEWYQSEHRNNALKILEGRVDGKVLQMLDERCRKERIKEKEKKQMLLIPEEYRVYFGDGSWMDRRVISAEAANMGIPVFDFNEPGVEVTHLGGSTYKVMVEM